MTLAGAARGAFTAIAFAIAVALSNEHATAGGAGTASGLLFSALAIGAFFRLAIVAAGRTRVEIVACLLKIAWAIAGASLVVVVRALWRRASPAAIR